MTVLRPDKQLRYLIELAEGKIPVEECNYRIDVDALLDLANSNPELKPVDIVADTDPYPAIFLDRAAAARELLLQFRARAVNRLVMPDVLREYMDRCIVRLAEGHSNPFNTTKDKHGQVDLQRKHEYEQLRALAEVEERSPSPDRWGDDPVEYAARRLNIDNDVSTIKKALKRQSWKKSKDK